MARERTFGRQLLKRVAGSKTSTPKLAKTPSPPGGPCIGKPQINRCHLACSEVFSKLFFFSGYFDPVKTFFDNTNHYISG